MTDFSEARSKKDRLVAAAVECFHKTGYARVTLGEVAQSANVPLGNVYYYFRTKAALAHAAVEIWTARVEAICSELDPVATPRRRLLAYLRRAEAARSVYTEFGCPLANLSRDLLASGEPDLSELAGHIYAGLYGWVETQFRVMGQPEALARANGRFVIASLQGGILMAHANQDSSLMTTQVRHLRQWLIQTTRNRG